MTEAQIRLRRTTLLDQFSVMEPKNLRELLKFHNEDDASGAGRRRNGIVTLASILESEKHGGRTLLDVIREEDEARGGTMEPGVGGRAPPVVEEEPTVRVSLMTLLALTDGAGGDETVTSALGNGGGGVAVVAVAEEERAEEDPPTVAVALADERTVCCVCMLRRKGAAFIPCGHTFCRVCSRELWTGRGNCPLCNALILDILDIF